MGFLSFNEKYYAEALRRLEGRKLNADELYEVGQLLKVLDDLRDEGYTRLNTVLEGKYRAVSRLRAILKFNGAEPFPVQKIPFSVTDYVNTESEIGEVCERLKNGAAPSDDPFLSDIRAFCAWIERRSDTAYVFLLRDAFLPYLYFERFVGGSLYPWVINRDFLRETAGDGVDDLIRLPVYEALESGIANFADFSAFCKVRIREVLSGYPELEKRLRELLCGIEEEKILVIESGYCGTIPLTLSALDDRVDLRMYTTAPYLYEIYRDKIFCGRYEQIRSFETLYSQDALMKYASFRNGKFYVRTAADGAIWERAGSEIAAVLTEK